MALKTVRPITPGQRGLVKVDRSQIWKGKPIKSLTAGLAKKSGRNNHGGITMRRRGGGHKKSYRQVDFKRRKIDIPAMVERIEYDPNRSAFLALIKYEDNEYSYILAPQKLSKGDKVIAGKNKEISPGNCMPLSDIPLGATLHNIETKIGKGGQLARSAGSSVQLVGKESGYAYIKLPSGEQRKILDRCVATIGSVSNPDNKNTQLGKAGRNRWLGKRPSVRGVAMNPVDHPHGGGEGRTSGGRHPSTPWGFSTKGRKTRKNKRTQKYIISKAKKRTKK